ncbi:unnamed protein product [Amoebophrya sp. A25]|nr:unnamed protein product [Amoebophrya sp. A25]|eukprot:GSA25T00016642001.1
MVSDSSCEADAGIKPFADSRSRIEETTTDHYGSANALLCELRRERLSRERVVVHDVQGRGLKVLERPERDIGSQLWREGTQALHPAARTELRRLRPICRENEKIAVVELGCGVALLSEMLALEFGEEESESDRLARYSDADNIDRPEVNKRTTSRVDISVEAPGATFSSMKKKKTTRVDFYATDQQKVLRYSEENLRSNCLEGSIHLRPLDWTNPGEAVNLRTEIASGCEPHHIQDKEIAKQHGVKNHLLVLGSECVYDVRLVRPMLETLKRLALGVDIGKDQRERELLFKTVRAVFSFSRPRRQAEEEFFKILFESDEEYRSFFKIQEIHTRTASDSRDTLWCRKANMEEANDYTKEFSLSLALSPNMFREDLYPKIVVIDVKSGRDRK